MDLNKIGWKSLFFIYMLWLIEIDEINESTNYILSLN
jgi:hypothetical protein